MALFKIIIPFLAVFHFTLLHFNSIKLGLLYFTSLHLLIIKAVFEESLYFKCIFEFRSLPPTRATTSFPLSSFPPFSSVESTPNKLPYVDSESIVWAGRRPSGGMTSGQPLKASAWPSPRSGRAVYDPAAGVLLKSGWFFTLRTPRARHQRTLYHAWRVRLGCVPLECSPMERHQGRRPRAGVWVAGRGWRWWTATGMRAEAGGGLLQSHGGAPFIAHEISNGPKLNLL